MMIKKLFIYIISVVFAVSVIDLACRLLMTPLFQNPSEDTKAGATYKFVSHKEPAELIILGASHAQHHYVSSQLEDSLNLSVYNYGSAGRCVLYQYLCLLKAIENGGLKTVILDLSYSQMSKKWVDDRISDLYPYYWSNDIVRNMVNEVCHKDMSLLMLSSLVQYNSQYLNFIAKFDAEKGYIPLPYKGKPLNLNMDKVLDEKPDDNYSKIADKYLRAIFLLCKKNKITLICCMSPSFSESKHIRDYIHNLCTQYEIEFWDYIDFTKDLMLYSDNSHLNHKGATIFTNEVIKRLK